MLKSPKTKLMTAEQLAKLSPDASRGELVRGEFIPMSPAGFFHGRIALRIGTFLNIYIMQHDIGEAYAAETGFILSKNPDTVRAPDVSFVTYERIRKQSKASGFFDGAPDLAVEVISPSETAVEIETKIIEYLEAGTQLVWIVYPQTETVTVHQAPNLVQKLNVDETLSGVPLLPDFSIPVRDIFS